MELSGIFFHEYFRFTDLTKCGLKILRKKKSISSSVGLFSFCLHSLPASESFLNIHMTKEIQVQTHKNVTNISITWKRKQSYFYHYRNIFFFFSSQIKKNILLAYEIEQPGSQQLTEPQCGVSTSLGYFSL